ncbi:MAG: hypothetical protein PHW24_04060 [Candidatus Moranbacteria bacterium]|nr:hypothetical protein [Candidatus Moranbacteria bacterium]
MIAEKTFLEKTLLIENAFSIFLKFDLKKVLPKLPFLCPYEKCGAIIFCPTFARLPVFLKHFDFAKLKIPKNIFRNNSKPTKQQTTKTFAIARKHFLAINKKFKKTLDSWGLKVVFAIDAYVTTPSILLEDCGFCWKFCVFFLKIINDFISCRSRNKPMSDEFIFPTFFQNRHRHFIF